MRPTHWVWAVALACGTACGGSGDEDTGAATDAASDDAAPTTSSPADTTVGVASTGGGATTVATTTSPTTSATTDGDDSTSGGMVGGDKVVFAVIGDFGDDFLANLGVGGVDQVATLVSTWNPDFVVTVGDNNYPDGAAGTIDANIGKHYAQYIGNYNGAFGPGGDENRFWPTLGNHDWNTPDVQPHLDYFDLPGNERYYDVDYGLVHVFAVDSETEEPDGATFDSVQGQWLQGALEASDACYKLVFFHRAAYSSGDHGSEMRMQWPFQEWGADAVLAGHDHTYERLAVGSIPYFVNGLGGSLPYQPFNEIPESEFFYNDTYGAQLVTATDTDITFEFYSVASQLIDSYTIEKDCGQ
jgi:hypothetical protein